MKTIKEMIEVMQAYADGNKIQHYSFFTHKWKNDNEPLWNWNEFDYRIKPKVKTYPMTYQEILDWWKKSDDTFVKIVNVNDEIIDTGYLQFITMNDYELLFKVGNQNLDYQRFIQHARKSNGDKFETEVSDEDK